METHKCREIIIIIIFIIIIMFINRSMDLRKICAPSSRQIDKLHGLFGKLPKFICRTSLLWSAKSFRRKVFLRRFSSKNCLVVDVYRINVFGEILLKSHIYFSKFSKHLARKFLYRCKIISSKTVFLKNIFTTNFLVENCL